MAELHESCAVWGLLPGAALDIASVAYASLFSMQHRGQNGVGVAGARGASVTCEKNLGMVDDVLTTGVLKGMARSRRLIGHIRYPAGGEANTPLNVQPTLMYARSGFMAMAHNGRLINASHIRSALMGEGALFQTDTDAEVLLHLLDRAPGALEERVARMMERARGSYALTLMMPDAVLGIRDPWGIRPLSIGRRGDSWMLASETCAFTSGGFELVRDVGPGEAVLLTPDGPETLYEAPRGTGSLCSFEFVYFARPDSTMDGMSIYAARERMGRLLYQVAPIDADIVSGVPDSGIPAAMGYARASGMPFTQAIVKSPYFGRTFIAETQAARDLGVRLKLHALEDQIAGKRLVLVDDSIVRGTNMIQLVSLLRSAGAREVHLRIASPPVMHPCHYGINTPTRRRLISTRFTAEELARQFGADSLAFLPQAALKEACRGEHGRCMACFDGIAPIGAASAKKEYIHGLT